jgi:UDP-N-acetylmuramoylalanine--D-glutamate ligase
LASLTAITKTPNVVTFGLSRPPSGKDFGMVQQGSADWLIRGGEALLPAADLKIEGRHNIGNALAALAIADTIVGGSTAEMVSALREFVGLPHRCEIVGDYRGVRWINDSKGTNVGATVAALEGMGRPVVLIAGGQAKNADFGPLARSAQRYARQVVLFGEDREQIGECLSRMVPVTTVMTLDEATLLASKWAQPGDVVLFSPACASFDMFDNFEQRGDTFRELVSGVNQ